MKSLYTIISILVVVIGSILSGCQSSNTKNTLKVAATSVPHAEILEQIAHLLHEEGINLEILITDDYNTPNRALADKEVDANFFQHIPFLNEQTKNFGYTLEVTAKVHIEPLGLYSYKIKSLSEIKQNARIAIPSDPSNQARALLLLEKSGLIKLKTQDITATLLSIAENPKNLKIIEIDSPLLTRSLDDVDLAAITTNFALLGNLSPKKDALALENANSDFVNVLVIRKGKSERKELQALKRALTSDTVRNFIEDRYQGAVLPAF